MIGKPQDPDSFSQQELRARHIMRAAFDRTMLNSVEFNGQLCSRAIEIENVWTHRMLAAERHAVHLCATKMKPEFLLRVCGVATKSSRPGSFQPGSIEARQFFSLPCKGRVGSL
jgi:hypothetical protein